MIYTNLYNQIKHEKARASFFELLTKNQHAILSVYDSAREPVTLRCRCGHEFIMTPSMYMVRGCPECAKKARKQQKLTNFLLEATEKGYTFECIPEAMNESITMTCERGHQFTTTGNKFLKRKFVCGLCTNRDPKLSEKRFKQAVAERNFKLIGVYEGNDIKVKMRCDNGHIVYISPHNLKKGRGCSHCSGKNSSDARERFKDFCKEHGHTLVRYDSSSTKATIRTPDGDLIRKTPDSFRHQIKKENI
ncbi:hypothetical protein L4D00_15055 [Photobacterium swingsii]|uniref:hypothetical protein n=1 Tax=Photobacterium swingsii TaxID=680026 RepID=UPI003D14581F